MSGQDPPMRLPTDPARWDSFAPDAWEYTPGDPDEAWDDPTLLRRRIGTPEELELVADAIVRRQRLVDEDPDGTEQVIVGVADDGDAFVSERVIVEKLQDLISAVQSHADVCLAHVETEEDADGHLRVTRRWLTDVSNTPIDEEDTPTLLWLRRSVVEACNFSGLDSGCTLIASARFAGVARFSDACFAADAWFGGARFVDVAGFSDARFAGVARFDGARFADDAWFSDARFAGVAWFSDACFAADAWFSWARFADVAGFSDARFAGVARFDGARFADDAWFSDARFAGVAGFSWARFAGVARFDGAVISPLHEMDGDLRSVDLRSAMFSGREQDPESDAVSRSRWRRIVVRCLRHAKRWFQLVGWTVVRAIGELTMLTRVSVIALILIPPVASAWPAIRAGVVGYNDAVDSAASTFEASARELNEAVASLDPNDRAALEERVAGVTGAIDAWSDRFGRMTIDDQNLPQTMAWTFFAAAFVTLGQLVYQSRAPSRVRKHDEDGFIEWMHTRYNEESPDRDDGLRRACDWLAAIARERDDRHANLVMHHREMVWIPPKDKINWFQDIELAETDTEDASGASEHGGDDVASSADTPTLDDGGDDQFAEIPRRTQYPEGYVPGAERARIALEEGAKAEYWMEARENLGTAWLCMILYGLGLGSLLVILIIQGWNVGRAAGFWG